MSLRFPFSTSPSRGESECKNTTIFQTTKIFFRFFPTFSMPRLVDSKLVAKKNLKNIKNSRYKDAKQHTAARKNTKNDTKSSKSSKNAFYSLYHSNLVLF